MIRNKTGGWGIAGGFLVALVIIACLAYSLAYGLTNGTETITIKEKWVKYHNDDAKYLVSSTQNEVYQITDTIFYLRWNSSDLYAKLQPGMVCKIQYQGFRFPIMSDYKNIITAECN